MGNCDAICKLSPCTIEINGTWIALTRETVFSPPLPVCAVAFGDMKFTSTTTMTAQTLSDDIRQHIMTSHITGAKNGEFPAYTIHDGQIIFS
jgi:hypothetical protein